MTELLVFSCTFWVFSGQNCWKANFRTHTSQYNYICDNIDHKQCVHRNWRKFLMYTPGSRWLDVAKILKSTWSKCGQGWCHVLEVSEMEEEFLTKRSCHRGRDTAWPFPKQNFYRRRRQEKTTYCGCICRSALPKYEIRRCRWVQAYVSYSFWLIDTSFILWDGLMFRKVLSYLSCGGSLQVWLCTHLRSYAQG